MTLELIMAVGFASVPITFLICEILARLASRSRRRRVVYVDYGHGITVKHFGARPVVDRYEKKDWPYKSEDKIYNPPNYWW